MGGFPSTFFLKASTSVIPARRQAIRANALSNDSSTFASARAVSSARTRLRNFSASFCASGVSTRITFPRLPLPYCRTHRCTVAAPRIPYFSRIAPKLSPPCSNSATTLSLKLLLYLTSSRTSRFPFIGRQPISGRDRSAPYLPSAISHLLRPSSSSSRIVPPIFHLRSPIFDLRPCVPLPELFATRVSASLLR